MAADRASRRQRSWAVRLGVVVGMLCAACSMSTGPEQAFGEGDGEVFLDLIEVAENPWSVALEESLGVAVAVSKGEAYGSRQGVVTVLDAVGRTAVATVPIEGFPETVAIDAPTARAFVVDTAGVVWVVDLDAAEVIETIEVGTDPQQIALDSELGVAIVGNRTDGTVSVLDIHTLRVDHVVPVGDGPEGVAIDSAHGVAYVANQDDGTVTVVDTATWTVADTVEVGGGPGGVALDERTGAVFVTSEGVVSVIDPVTRQVSTWVPMPEPYAVTVDSSRGLVYVADDSGLVAVIDAQTGDVQDRVDIGISVHSLAVDGTGQVWASSGLGDWAAVLSRDPPADDHNRDQFVDWALGRFTLAGLDAPVVSSVQFNPLHPRCSDVAGFAAWSGDSADIIICTSADLIDWVDPASCDSAGAECVQAWPSSRAALVLHEFGHAWLNTHLEQTRRNEFMTHVGVTTWRDSAEPWAQRGVERAAETIAWGLGDQGQVRSRFGPLGPFGDPPCQTLADGFTILTAAAPLHTCDLTPPAQ